MHADLARGLRQRRVVGEQCATVAITTQGLAGEKTRRTKGRQTARALALVQRAKTLRAVFDHRQTMLRSNGIDGRHVGHLAVQTHRHDGARTRCDLGADQVGVDVAGVGLDVHKHWLGTQQHDGLCRGGKGKRRGDDFVTGLDAQSHHGDEQGFGATGHTDAVRTAREGGQHRFHLGHLGPHDVLAMVQHRLHARVDAGFERGVLRFQIGELHAVFDDQKEVSMGSRGACNARPGWPRAGCPPEERRFYGRLKLLLPLRSPP